MHVEFNVIPMQVIQIFKNIERCTFLQILKKNCSYKVEERYTIKVMLLIEKRIKV